MSWELDRSIVQNGRAELPSAKLQARLRVLQIGKFYPPHMGGIETHLQALCGALSEHVDPQVIVSNDDRCTVQEVLDGVPVLRVGTLLTAFSAAICPAMVSSIRRSTADLVHLHLPNPTAVLAYLASGHQGRLVITYHSDTVRQKFLGTLFQPLLRAILRRSAGIIVTSPNYLQSSSVLSAFHDRSHVIPYGIDTSQFERCDPEEVKPIRERYGERLIVSVGRLVYYKGFEHLIRAMVGVKGRLLLVGGGPLRAQLENLAVSLGIADKVVFLGEMQNAAVVPYYHAADLFVLPSVARSEAFGIVQIEAMAAGLPVVNTRLDSGVPYVSVHDETGFTVPPGNPEALTDAINRLLDDPELRKSFGRAGVRRAKREFSLETMTNRILRLYEAVLNA